MTELLVGTKKGLFVLEGEPGAGFRIASRAFAGDVVEFAVRDARTGRTFASVGGFYGPRLMYTDDLSAEWQQAKGPVFPEDLPDAKVERIWVVKPGEADGLLYAGITLGAKAAQLYFGDAGLYLAGALAGVTDVDAITLSMSNLAASSGVEPVVAARTIGIAVLSNTVTKCAMVCALGATPLRRAMVPIGASLATVGLAALLLAL